MRIFSTFQYMRIYGMKVARWEKEEREKKAGSALALWTYMLIMHTKIK